MRKKTRAGRGRPRGSHRARSDTNTLEYLVEVATKHGAQHKRIF